MNIAENKQKNTDVAILEKREEKTEQDADKELEEKLRGLEI